MSEKNKIIEKPKLNIFQRIIKRITIKKFSRKKYKEGNFSYHKDIERIPDYLKTDDEVICAISKISEEYFMKLHI